MVTKPLVMAVISVVVFGLVIIGLKVFIFVRTGEFTRMDLIEIVTWLVIAFIWPFFFQKRK